MTRQSNCMLCKHKHKIKEEISSDKAIMKMLKEKNYAVLLNEVKENRLKLGYKNSREVRMGKNKPR